METVFQVGDKVCDSVRFPNVEGKVIDIKNNENYPIIVEYGRIRESYTLDSRFNKDYAPTLSFTPYKVEVNHKRPVQLPEIGSLCAFSDIEDFNHYSVDILIKIECGFFYNEEETSWRYCKQIETIKFK